MYIPNVTPAVLVTPAVSTNARGDKVYKYDASDGATRTGFSGWLQQRGVQSVGSSRNRLSDGRNAGDSTWVFFTNQAGATRYNRIEFNGDIFQIDGEPYPTRSLAPGIDHFEINLRLVEG